MFLLSAHAARSASINDRHYKNTTVAESMFAKFCVQIVFRSLSLESTIETRRAVTVRSGK